MIDQIRPSQLAQWIQAQGGTVTVLDVREAMEVRTASVKPDGFTLIHIPMNAVPARAAELDRDAPIACLCHHGGRSQQVANFLASQGFSRVANVAGGIDAWACELDTGIPRY